jgi:L-threonylcarbamoyladenylate synthase
VSGATTGRGEHRGLTDADARRLRGCLAAGGVAVLPTDTVYGVACDARRRGAVERLYELKGRPARRPAAVMFLTLARALHSLPDLQSRELAAIEALLPGPVTLLLPNRAASFALACSPDPSTLGLRVPLLAGALAALERVDSPLLQSSANLSGRPAARRVADLPRELLDGADLVLDAGELPGTASTVLDLRSFQERGTWSVVREGALQVEAVERALSPSS